MTVIHEYPLENFAFWGGAKVLADRLTRKEFKIIEDYLETNYENLTCGQINDMFWFEDEYLISEVLYLDPVEFWGDRKLEEG